jgi:hypothetical protein
MFIHMFDKIYAVNSTCEPQDSVDIRKRFIDYHGMKCEHPFLETLYDEIMDNRLPGGIEDRSVNVLIVPDEQYNELMQDYCIYLGLDYKAYSLIKWHSSFCICYLDNVAETISQGFPYPVIKKENFIVGKKKIRRGYEHFPVEFAVNSNEKWANDKRDNCRIHEVFEVIKDYQYKCYREGIPCPTCLKNFSASHQSAKALKEPAVMDACLSALNDLDISIEHNRGYNRFHGYKYNFPLEKYLKKEGYRIDG